MAFKSGPVAIGATDTDVFLMPATLAGVVILKLSSVVTVDRYFTLKFYKQSTGVTTTLANASNWTAKRMDDIGKFSMEAGDKLIMSAEVVSALVATPLIVQLGQTSASKGFIARGAYSSGATYAINDVVRVDADKASYISLEDGNINNAPSSSPSKWMKWLVDGPQGTPGTGDMQAANNLSDLASIPTAQANLRLTPLIHRLFGGL